MSILFEPASIGKLRLKNRFLRSATHDGWSTERGEVTDNTLDLYGKLAAGGAALIVSGFAYVHSSGQAFAHQMAIDRDECISGLRRLTNRVHESSGKIALQLAHGGRSSRATRQRGEIPMAPSLLEKDLPAKEVYREMTAGDIEEIIQAFALAALRAREAGFDALQLHGAHSYLFSQFLSPASNKRDDQWGGDEGRRMQFHLKVLEAVRSAVGPEFPVFIKLGVQDTVEKGMTLEDGCRAAREMALQGIDAIEVSEGLETMGANHIRKGIVSRSQEAYYASWARNVKENVHVPVILVGGLRSYEVVETMVREGYADLVSLCRPFIREPDLVNRWQGKDKSPAACISCNLCLRKIIKEEGLQCAQKS